MGDLEDDHFSTTSVTLHVYDLCQILGRKDPKINGNQKKLFILPYNKNKKWTIF
jgi:hypothetical protein